MGRKKDGNDDIDDHQSFVIEIKNQENHTWQGSIMWIEGRKKENFRSALELLRLMDSACKREAAV